jgi:hypothetical protein
MLIAIVLASLGSIMIIYQISTLYMHILSCYHICIQKYNDAHGWNLHPCPSLKIPKRTRKCGMLNILCICKFRYKNMSISLLQQKRHQLCVFIVTFLDSKYSLCVCVRHTNIHILFPTLYICKNRILFLTSWILGYLVLQWVLDTLDHGQLVCSRMFLIISSYEKIIYSVNIHEIGIKKSNVK